MAAMEAQTGAQLAELAGVSEAGIGRMVDLGVLVAREEAAPFLWAVPSDRT
jgi:hypothetical protein